MDPATTRIVIISCVNEYPILEDSTCRKHLQRDRRGRHRAQTAPRKLQRATAATATSHQQAAAVARRATGRESDADPHHEDGARSHAVR